MKKMIALLLALMICLPAVAACKKEEAPVETETDAPLPISVIVGGASEYVIVYAPGEGNMQNIPYTVGLLIQATVKTVTGVEMKLVSDTTAPQAKEILIGTTSRADSYTSPVAAETYLNGYSLFADGEKIILEAGSKAGMHFGAYALLKELLGVDLRNGEEAVRDESKTDCSVLSNLALTETLASALVPYMDVPLEQFAVCYDSTNYIQMRAAITLQQEIKDFDSVTLEKVLRSRAEDDGAYFYFEQDDAAKDGEFKITTEGKRVILSAKDYYGYVSAVRAVMKLRQEIGFYPFSDKDTRSGNHLDYLKKNEETSRYAFNNSSEYRVMFYNVLYEPESAAERAKLQSAMIDVYRPDVIGCQEFSQNRRGTLDTMLQKLGYAETMNYKSGNFISGSSGATNSSYYSWVPIFYNTATTKCVDTGFYRFEAQISASQSESKTLCWAVMESKSGGERYLVVNVHMCVGDDTIRLRQAVEAVDLINQLLTQYNVPVFLGGDYNGTYSGANFTYFARESSGFKDVEKNNLATEYTSKLKSYHRPYPAYNGAIGLMWPDAKDDTGVNPSGSVDHIMIKNASAVKISVYGIIADDCTMSSGDHYPIFADFSIN